VNTKVHVKKGDTVYVLTGKDEGKKGKVLGVNPSEGTVLVQGVNMVTKHTRPRSRTQQGGILHQESPVNSSKVMLVCPKCGNPSKYKREILEDGNKARVCKRCKETIDLIKEGKADAQA